jgi:hypothetical protein
MAAPKPKTETRTDIEAKLVDGTYDRLLADFQAKLDAATEALRRVHEAMRAENTLRS